MNNNFQINWTIPVDSGDGIIIFADELLSPLDWTEGDELSINIIDNSIQLTKSSSA